MKEEWLFTGAVVPVDVETTQALVAEIKRLIDVVGGMALAQPAQETAQLAHIAQFMKELRPAIGPMATMGKSKTTQEWFDIVINEIERLQPVQQEALYGMNQDDWKDVVAAIAKVRDGRGIYLGCRPADVFQDWFLALGTAKVKEKNNA